MTCEDIISELTWQTISMSLNVSRTAVLNARSKGEFPASWYLGLSTLCKENGIVCPDALFGFKGAATRGAAA